MLYGSYSALLPEWQSGWGVWGPGALVFLPSSYSCTHTLTETEREFWPVLRLRSVIVTAGVQVEGLDEFLDGVDPATEILVMILESGGGKPVAAVHLYRIPEIREN
jgi:hypothetical protein